MRKGPLRIALLVVVAAAFLWHRTGQRFDRDEEPRRSPAPALSPGASGNPVVGGYELLEGARLVDHRGNDGDSFHVSHGGRQFELRLYYVDAPETYLSDRHESQRRRVADQAAAFGDITVEEAIAVGREARQHVRELLADRPFDVYTRWERVFDSDRYYGFVRLPGEERLLCEELVARGLARIHTKGEATPDGVPFRRHRDHLRRLEQEAREARRGGWRY